MGYIDEVDKNYLVDIKNGLVTDGCLYIASYGENYIMKKYMEYTYINCMLSKITSGMFRCPKKGMTTYKLIKVNI